MNNLKEQFLLNPEITFFNFGSFGACPKPIFEDLQRWQRELEFEPVQFITKSGVQYLKNSRKALADYIHCDPNDLIFVPNPTYAVNLIAKSWKFNPGDEILTTNLEYGAIDRTWKFYAKERGYNYVQQEISLPLASKEDFIAQFWKGLTKNTKAIFISQITSATGLILPVAEICREAKAKGLLTIVDGAHVPGHIPLDLAELEADFYTGACHKWMMTPKGSSFIYVKKEFQPALDPLIVSWGYESLHPSDSKFFDYHQFNGTRDFSAYLTIPKSLEFMRENNWDQVAASCRKLVQDNALRFTELLNTKPLAPLGADFFGQMCSIPMLTDNVFVLHEHLLEKYHIQIPVFEFDHKQYIRFSIQAFNSQEDLDKLYEALAEIKHGGMLY